MTDNRQNFAVRGKGHLVGRRKLEFGALTASGAHRSELKRLAVSGPAGLQGTAAALHFRGYLFAVERVNARAAHSAAAPSTAAAAGSGSTRGRTGRRLSGSHFRLNTDLLVVLRDGPYHALCVLRSRIQALALFFIQLPGAGKTWRRHY